MPSNIIYRTPSNGNRNPYSDNPGSTSDADHTTREFNDSVELIFENIEAYELVDSALSHIEGPNARLSEKLFTLGSSLAIDGNYRAAEQAYKLARLHYAALCGPNDWRTVGAEFRAALMKAADFPGCPQTITARFAQELSHFLMRERQIYNQANPQESDLVELRKTLTGLKMNTEWASYLITQQRALQIWEPVLGPEHSKIKLMRTQIAKMKKTRPVDLNQETSLIQDAEDSLPTFEPNNYSQLKSIGGLLHLCDGSPDDLLRKFRALENSDILSRQFQQEIELLRYGRSRSLLGGYLSFLRRFDDAEKAFQESDRYMKYEACVEIKLHRILWYAEHKTRVRDAEGVVKLMCQAHDIFMKNDSPSEFIIAHFPDRFKYLCKAVSKRVPIDEVLNEPIDYSVFERHRSSSLPASVHHIAADRPHSALASPIPSPERLFPLTPRGFNSAIDVDTWRQFVNFSPQMDSPRRGRSLSIAPE
jgi:hypothetical protein